MDITSYDFSCWQTGYLYDLSLGWKKGSFVYAIGYKHCQYRSINYSGILADGTAIENITDKPASFGPYLSIRYNFEKGF